MSTELPLEDTAETKLSAPELCEMLRAKYPRDRYAVFFDVPDAVSLQQRRRIDALAFGMWRSEGQLVEGFELKISRSDWLREVKQVEKADPFVALCDRFWLVTADTKIARLDEIPACWGWMAATKAGLRVQKPAARLPGTGSNMPRSFVFGLLRKMQEDLLANPDVQALIQERVGKVEERIESNVKYRTSRLQQQFDDLQKRVVEFEAQSGINLTNWRFREAGKIVRQLLELGYGSEGGLNHVPKMLEQQANALRITLEQVERARAQLQGEGA